jgi:hypothetical protein
VLSNTLSQGDMVDFAWLAVDLDRREEALAVVEQCESADWALIGRSILTGEPATAIEMLTRMGRATSAAYTALRAGGDHGGAALRFYESVGATRFAQLALDSLGTPA